MDIGDKDAEAVYSEVMAGGDRNAAAVDAAEVADEGMDVEGLDEATVDISVDDDDDVVVLIEDFGKEEEQQEKFENTERFVVQASLVSAPNSMAAVEAGNMVRSPASWNATAWDIDLTEEDVPMPLPTPTNRSGVIKRDTGSIPVVEQAGGMEGVSVVEGFDIPILEQSERYGLLDRNDSVHRMEESNSMTVVAGESQGESSISGNKGRGRVIVLKTGRMRSKEDAGAVSPTRGERENHWMSTVTQPAEPVQSVEHMEREVGGSKVLKRKRDTYDLASMEDVREVGDASAHSDVEFQYSDDNSRGYGANIKDVGDEELAYELAYARADEDWGNDGLYHSQDEGFREDKDRHPKKAKKAKQPSEIPVPCRRGNKCRNIHCNFQHPLKEAPKAKISTSRGYCKYGSSCNRRATCAFLHKDEEDADRDARSSKKAVVVEKPRNLAPDERSETRKYSGSSASVGSRTSRGVLAPDRSTSRGKDERIGRNTGKSRETGLEPIPIKCRFYPNCRNPSCRYTHFEDSSIE